ncbi:MAG: ROK family protein [Prolixibacteraceae bacterium]|jgi:glucokinase|nr:ROK family protein [Prolixibacteraceae bacterium]
MQEIIDKYYIGLDIGGTKCAVIAGDDQFNIFRKVRFDTKTERGVNNILAEFFEKIDELLLHLPKERLSRIGISCGGPLDSEKGIILSPPNLPGWDQIPIVEIFSKRYSVPVSVQNDANACALAEWLMGAGKGTRNMIFLTFGTGMGSGLILNGRLYTGTNDLGGEVGHVRLATDGPVGFGKAGSFEGFCSGGGIAQLAKKIVKEKTDKGIDVEFCKDLTESGELTAREIAGAARDGNPVADEIIKISAEYLGRGLAVLIDIINPECIVIGSIYARNESMFRPHVERLLKEEAIPAAVEACKIKPAMLGESVGDYAALCVALYSNDY